MKLNEIRVPGYILAARELDESPLSFLCVLHNGQVGVFSTASNTFQSIWELPTTIDLKEIKVYIHRSYVAVVGNKQQHGIVYDLSNPSYAFNLSRRDYQVEHCSFPIAFYAAQDQTFLIHGTDWNRLDITCLDTGELLTARTVDYETKTNYLDYFHSSLLMAPDHQRFLSNGWIWSPVDIITVYEVADFLQRYEPSLQDMEMPVTTGYLWDRGVAWMDAHTLAVVYNQQEETGEGSSPSELLFFDVTSGDLKERISCDHFNVYEDGEIFDQFFYSSTLDSFIILGLKGGIKVTNRKGELIFSHDEIQFQSFAPVHSLVYGWHKDRLWYLPLEK